MRVTVLDEESQSFKEVANSPTARGEGDSFSNEHVRGFVLLHLLTLSMASRKIRFSCNLLDRQVGDRFVGTTPQELNST